MRERVRMHGGESQARTRLPGAEAVEFAGHTKPQVVLMDVCMPVMDGGRGD